MLNGEVLGSIKKNRLKLFFIGTSVVLLSLIAGPLLHSESANAISNSDCTTIGGTSSGSNCNIVDKMSPADQLKSYAYFNALSSCSRSGLVSGVALTNQWKSSITPANAKSPGSAWIGDAVMSVGFVADSTDGKYMCSTMISKALTLWKYSSASYEDFLKAMGYTLIDEQKCTSGQINNSTTCEKTGNKIWSRDIGGDIFNAFRSEVKSRVYGGKDPTLEGNYGLLYYRAQAHLETTTSCGATPYKAYSDLTADEKSKYTDTTDINSAGQDYVVVKMVDGTTWKTVDWVYKIAKTNYLHAVSMGEKPSGGAVVWTCAKIAQDMSSYAQKIADDATAIQKLGDNPADKYGSIVVTPGQAAVTVVADGAGETTPGVTSCGLGDLAWLICPALSLMATILDDSFQVLSNDYLKVDIRLLAPDTGTFVAWSIFRNFANVAFVIVFLIIIFSQMTGAGVTNYGVKKMLPRLIVAAILVNISYYVCQIAVDLSNILGFSMKSLFDGIATASNIPTEIDAKGNGLGVVSLVGGVVATTAIAYFSLAALIPVLIGALVGVIMIILILMARKALIVILIVLAPLAFVAFLLPNTESLFKSWRKMFTTLLILFPIISIVFGASHLASQIILQANPIDTNNKIVALGVMAVPFFAVPILLKASLDSIGGIGAKLNGFASRAGGKLGSVGGQAFANSRVAQFQNYRKTERDKRRALMQSGAYNGKGGLWNPRNWNSALNRGFNASGISGKFGDRATAQGTAAADKIQSEQIGELASHFEGSIDPNKLVTEMKKALAEAIQKGDVIKARAAQQVLGERTGAKGLDGLHAVYASSLNSREAATGEVGTSLRRGLGNIAGLKGKDAVLDQFKHDDWGADGSGFRDVSGIAADAATYRGLNPEELAAQTFTQLSVGSAGITHEMAQTVLNTENAKKFLTDEKRTFFESK